MVDLDFECKCNVDGKLPPHQFPIVPSYIWCNIPSSPAVALPLSDSLISQTCCSGSPSPGASICEGNQLSTALYGFEANFLVRVVNLEFNTRHWHHKRCTSATESLNALKRMFSPIHLRGLYTGAHISNRVNQTFTSRWRSIISVQSKHFDGASLLAIIISLTNLPPLIIGLGQDLSSFDCV